jgi:hypothetical protein
VKLWRGDLAMPDVELMSSLETATKPRLELALGLEDALRERWSGSGGLSGTWSSSDPLRVRRNGGASEKGFPSTKTFTPPG